MMIDVFTPIRISDDCLFKSNHRQVKNSILFLLCAIYLRGTIEYLGEIDTELEYTSGYFIRGLDGFEL